MMIKWFWILFTFYTLELKAQYDNSKWIFGFDPSVLTFNEDTITTKKVIAYPSAFFFDAGHSNINKNKDLLFSCNGFNIYSAYNDSGSIMENGEYIIPNKFVDQEDGFSSRPQLSIILPKEKNQYYVFATGMSNNAFDSAMNGGEFKFDLLTCSIVDISLNNGKGKVVEKGKEIISNGRLSGNSLTATIHANGRDWWLIKPEKDEHLYYKFLITKDSIYGPSIQDMNGPALFASNSGQSSFSLDGSLYALTQYGSPQIIIDKFDRCTGVFTKFKTVPRFMDTVSSEYSSGSGLCFSPNNQFLYISTFYTVWQYDLNNSELINLRNDSSVSNAWGNMFLGMDNRIYIGNLGGSWLSYIREPNKKGIECGLCKNCYKAITPSIHFPPNMPNYSLGPLKGSPCDTIGKLYNSNITIYPNPASESIHIYIPLPMNTKMKASLYNLLGQRIATWNEILNSKQEVELQLHDMTIGLYTIRIEAEGERYVGKLVVE